MTSNDTIVSSYFDSGEEPVGLVQDGGMQVHRSFAKW